MDWQTRNAETMPATLIPESFGLVARAPATGAWRPGDPLGNRQFTNISGLDLEFGAHLPSVTIAYETWGTLSPNKDNAVLILHALTGDSHVMGEAGPGHPTSGWWPGIVGPGLVIDTNRWFVITPNVLGGCQGTTGPASLAPDGLEWGARFPYVTVRDQVAAQQRLAASLGVRKFAAVIGGSMGGMQALEWAVSAPSMVERVAVLAAPPATSADQIALNAVQLEAIRNDPAYSAGAYYDAPDGNGPSHGLALARRMAMLNYRTANELDGRFGRSWQSDVSPFGVGGRFAIESYLDFHGNKFTRRFDANSYIALIQAMNSHDIGRDRDGIRSALQRVTAKSLVVGIDSDRYFPLAGQRQIAEYLSNSVHGLEPVTISSEFGHDAFLIEDAAISSALRRLLQA